MSKLQALMSIAITFGVAVAGVLLVLAQPLSAQERATQSLQDLLSPPADTVDAENVRIWLPKERKNTCRVTIDILNDSGEVVRHLLSELLHWGYYNFYWDKKDDSGRFVPEGEYRYTIDNCGTERKGHVKVTYRKGEDLFNVYQEVPDSRGLIPFDILKDSTSVSMMVVSPSGRIVDTIAVDSLMNTGHYEVQWVPAGPSGPGMLKFKMTVGDFDRETPITRPQ